MSYNVIPRRNDYLVSNEKRNHFIVNLVKSLKGNTLVLFQYVEKHGEVLYDMMFNTDMGNLHYVYGKSRYRR